MPDGALGAVFNGIVYELAADAEPALPVLMRADSVGPIVEWTVGELGLKPVGCHRQWQERCVRST